MTTHTEDSSKRKRQSGSLSTRTTEQAEMIFQMVRTYRTWSNNSDFKINNKVLRRSCNLKLFKVNGGYQKPHRINTRSKRHSSGKSNRSYALALLKKTVAKNRDHCKIKTVRVDLRTNFFKTCLRNKLPRRSTDLIRKKTAWALIITEWSKVSL